mgnify:CR=1 FL=1
MFVFLVQRAMANIRTIMVVRVHVGLVFLTTGDTKERNPLSSAETRFVEKSAGGMQIVPASCPSDPHVSGECDTPPQPVVGCILTASLGEISAGETSVLHWSSETDFNNPWNRVLSPVPGEVPWAGTWTVAPTVTTTYVLTMSRMSTSCTDSACGAVPVATLETQSCSVTVEVVQVGGQCTPHYYCIGNDQYFRNSVCSPRFIQACAYGCAGGSCLTEEGNLNGVNLNITANPALLKRGNTTTVSWSSLNMASCQVTENNPDFIDFWNTEAGTDTSGEISQQTVYTLTCIDANNVTYTDTATVNVLPDWVEK